jgi:hypothetical protein
MKLQTLIDRADIFAKALNNRLFPCVDDINAAGQPAQSNDQRNRTNRAAIELEWLATAPATATATTVRAAAIATAQNIFKAILNPFGEIVEITRLTTRHGATWWQRIIATPRVFGPIITTARAATTGAPRAAAAIATI